MRPKRLPSMPIGSMRTVATPAKTSGARNERPSATPSACTANSTRNDEIVQKPSHQKNWATRKRTALRSRARPRRYAGTPGASPAGAGGAVGSRIGPTLVGVKAKETVATSANVAVGLRSQTSDPATKHRIRPTLPSRFMTPLAVLRCSRGVGSGSSARVGVSAVRSERYIRPATRAAAPRPLVRGSPNTQAATPGIPPATHGARRPKRPRVRSLR